VSDALVATCEALLFIASEPLELHELAGAAEADEQLVERALGELERRLMERGAGVVLDRSSGRFGLRAAPGGPAEAASRLQARAPERGLSPAALEALAVVAYLQPVGRPEIARIRGVSSDAVVAGLLERQLIEESGRGEGLGAPVLYRTTTTFERIFGLEEGVTGLPGLPGLPGVNGDAELDSAELRQRLHAVAAERG
jgi:segregation and condensation protein B